MVVPLLGKEQPLQMLPYKVQQVLLGLLAQTALMDQQDQQDQQGQQGQQDLEDLLGLLVREGQRVLLETQLHLGIVLALMHFSIGLAQEAEVLTLQDQEAVFIKQTLLLSSIQ